MEFMLGHLWQVWAALFVLFLIAELSSGSLYVLCFAVGAVVALLASFVCGLYAQVIIFAVVSLLSIFMLRPVALKYLHKGEDKRVSGAEAIIGRKGRVSQTIEAGGFGRVAIDGDDWKAESVDGQEIPAGTSVVVVSIESIIIKVKP